MIRRRAIRVAAVAISTSLVVAACGNDKGSDSGSATGTGSATKGTVTLWSSFTDQKEIAAFKPIIDACEKKYPGLKIDYVAKDELSDAVSAAVEAGQAPDALQADFTGDIASKVAGDQLIPIEDLQGTDKISWGDFVPGAEKLATYQGKHWGIPLSLDTAALFVNKDSLADAGLTAAPTTLDELQNHAEKLLKANPDGSIERIGFVPDVGDGSFVTFAGAMFGAKAFSEDGKTVTIASDPAWKKSLEWQKKFYDLMDKDQFKKFVDAFGSYDSADNFFIKGQLAEYLEASYFASWPERFGNGKPASWTIAPMPGPDGVADPSKLSLITSGNMFMVPKGAKNPKLSWTAIKCMATASDAIAGFENTVANIPANVAALDAYEADVTKKIPQFQTFIDLARSPNPTLPPESLANGTMNDEMTSLAIKYRDGEIEDLDKALQDVQDKVQEDLDSQLQGGG